MLSAEPRKGAPKRQACWAPQRQWRDGGRGRGARVQRRRRSARSSSAAGSLRVASSRRAAGSQASSMRTKHVNVLIALAAVMLFSFSCFCISRMTQTSKLQVASAPPFPPASPASGLGDCQDRWGPGGREGGSDGGRRETMELRPALLWGVLQM